ncbi:sugar phosphate isomerase/epimerase family protein [Pseudovibrio sp. Tun.PSC04-5.I4]|uniref:sugar phosphate isomerase/epimerase family protein n=1 Tax=Pseudovibrio sp. Tun.PSC04-5.I4 TaxID=1798213 RepID=UPI00088C1F41|nr:sugar phosphate isomerase/epimerase family protein [Pseudovibrio sp. Tun.PSC04-5.I4]SDQ14227.1 Sugar phosphate isomerase/epimerase [Pseudovibrio sp. Tun.PSC04-5.I4]
MKLGVICDGVSRNLSHTVDVMDEFGLEYAELQFVGDTEVGDHTAEEIIAIDTLLRDRGKPVSCLSRHIFAGMTGANKPGDDLHTKHMDALKRVIDMAHVVGSPLVRIMSPKKEQILWGHNGAERWNVANGAWDAMLPLIAPAIDVAKDAGVKLVVETGNGTMINSNYTGRKLIDDLDAKGTLQILWDPANNCWCHERAFPEGYAEAKDGYLGHIHIKDVLVDTPRATLTVKKMGEGQLADQFKPMADALRADNYDGVISFESVYHPGNNNFEDGFRQCIGLFKELFA